MICPLCNSEYRPGFTRCEPCGTDLVETLDAGAVDRRAPPPASELSTPTSFAEFCGFLDLEAARRERDRLRESGIVARISIRESPAGHLTGPIQEEFWLLVPVRAISDAEAILGYDHVANVDDGSVICSACGSVVQEQEHSCPRCGAHFEDGP